MAQNIDLKPYVALVQAECELVSGTLREKGGKRFGKAFGVAGVLVFAAYAVVYAPPMKKKARLRSEIDAARAISEAGAQYKDLRDQLAACYAQLPLPKDRESFLSGAVIDSLRAGGLTPESFQPVREQEQAGLLLQAASIAMPARFADFHSWLARVEDSKPLTHLQNVSLEKKSDVIGLNAVQAEIATVIPKKRFD